MDRRRILAGTSAFAATALAGCFGGDSEADLPTAGRVENAHDEALTIGVRLASPDDDEAALDQSFDVEAGSSTPIEADLEESEYAVEVTVEDSDVTLPTEITYGDDELLLVRVSDERSIHIGTRADD